MIRNFRAVMVRRLNEAQAIAVQEDVPGTYYDGKRGRLYVPGDALLFARLWMTKHGLPDNFTIEENPYRRNNVPRDQWMTTPEALPDLAPTWREKLHPKQREAFAFALDRQGALLQLPTGRGKTLLAVLLALAYLRTHKQKTLIVTVVPEQVVGAFRKFTTGNVKVAQVVGRVGFEAVRRVDEPTRHFQPLVTQTRMLAELRAMSPKRRKAATEALQEGPKGRAVPAVLKGLVTVEVIDPPPRWDIVRRADNRVVGAVHLGHMPLLTDAQRKELQAEQIAGTVAGADDKAKRKARVAAYVLARELGQSLEAIAARYDVPVMEVDEAVTAWGADAMCAIRSTSDLGVPADTDVVVIHWALLVSRVAAIKAFQFDTVIFDESQEAKSSKRYRSTRNLDGTRGPRVPCQNQSWAALAVSEALPRAWLLTWTPDQHSIEDLWAQYDLINPRGWGSFSTCGKRYFGGIPGEHGMVYGKVTNAPEFKARAANFHLYIPKADMPVNSPFTRSILHVPVAEVGRSRISTTEWKLHNKSASSLLELRLVDYAEMMDPWAIHRVQWSVENGERIAVVAGRLEHVDSLFKALRKRLDPSIPIWTATGEVSTGDRQDIVSAFAASRPGVLICTSDAMGTGIDGMQNTHRVLVLLTPWNHGRLQQLEGRWDRFSEEEGLVTEIEYPIIAGTVGEELIDNVIAKAEVSAELGNQDAAALAKALSRSVAEEDRPAALEAMAARMLAAAAEREARIAEQEAAARAASLILPVSDDEVELLDMPESEHIDIWRDG